MTATLQAIDPLLPRPQRGMGKGAMMALVVHAVLLLALAGAVNWRTRAPETVSAELWASVPQVAAPKAVEPAPLPTPKPPAPVVAPAAPKPPPVPVKSEADIAIDKAKVEKERQARIEQERDAETKRQRERDAELLRKQRELQKQRQVEQAAKDKEEQEKARKAAEARKAEEARIEAQRQANLKRMLGQAGATGAATSTGKAAQSAGPSASYGGVLRAHIQPNIVVIDTLPASLEAIVEVRASPTGNVLSRRLVRSSGNPTWDDAVLRAIDRSGKLPPDKDGRVPSSIEISFKPE